MIGTTVVVVTVVVVTVAVVAIVDEGTDARARDPDEAECDPPEHDASAATSPTSSAGAIALRVDDDGESVSWLSTRSAARRG